MINIKGIKPKKQLFHNVRINVYPINVSFEVISFWKRNLRTILALNSFEKKIGKKIDDIPLEEITGYLVKQRWLKLKDLADSIERNGVRVPLIILRREGTLLDGNRRYFACHYILIRSERKGAKRPSVLDKIPVWVMKDEEVDDKMRQKILAEANFVPDYKIPWTDDVKARVVYKYFNSCIKQGMAKEKAYKEVYDVYSVKKETADAYIDSIKLTKEFIRSATQKDKDLYKEIVQDKFVYFWEFRDKAYTQKLSLDEKKELPKVKELFFTMIANESFRNMKQVEPMIRAVRDNYRWRLLTSSGGAKIDQVEAMFREEKAIRKLEDRIRNFYKLLSKIDTSNLSKSSIKWLKELIIKCKEIIAKQK